MVPTKTYHALGLMSGSSLDGLDIAYCRFKVKKTAQQIEVIHWEILQAETAEYTEMWQARLRQLPQQNALAFAKTHTYLGHYFADLVNDFLSRHACAPDFIASHGHTIFHEPLNLMTIQIGDGSALAAKTGYPVINNFRHQDVALNGQGAPVAPIVDKYLLNGYDFYLNLGGIANISCVLPNKTVAFDICPANQLLNYLTQKIGLEFDNGGQIAASGKVHQSLLADLNKADFYRIGYPKSLDNAWSQTALLSQLPDEPSEIPNQLCTLTEHIAFQIAFAVGQVIRKEKVGKTPLKILVTGGGAFNVYLIERLRHHCKAIGDIEIVVPDPDIIQFKEALLMAWMGVLWMENIPNVLQSVTGADRDTVNGTLHQGWRKSF